MLYFDTSYLVRLYTRDVGWQKVRAVAATDSLACSLHGRAEAVAAFHRKLREGAITRKDFAALAAEFEKDCAASAFTWLPMSHAVIERVIKVYASLSATTHLRAADALHLGCAAENKFRDVYSNDWRLLDVSREFGLSGINVL